MTRLLAPDHPFRRDSDNLAAIEHGLVQAERAHKQAIRRRDAAEIDFHARMHMLVVGLMAEARLRKILSDPDGFNDRERDLIRREPQPTSWTAAVEYSFRRHYGIPIHKTVGRSTLDVLKARQHELLIQVLQTDLAAIITDRNRTAHAQWRWHLKSHKHVYLTDPAPAVMNYLQVQRRSRAITLIATLVYVLAVSEKTFQRDFDVTFAELQAVRLGFDGADYAAWAAALPRPHLVKR